MDTSDIEAKTTRTIFPPTVEHIHTALPSTATVTRSNNFHCKQCKSEFATISMLKYHKLQKHGKWSKKSWTCKMCQHMNASRPSKVFSTQSNLNKHLRNIHGTGPLLKTTDDIKVEDSDSAKGEILTESIVPCCPYCSYTTWDSHNLRVHMRKHTGTVWSF